MTKKWKFLVFFSWIFFMKLLCTFKSCHRKWHKQINFILQYFSFCSYVFSFYYFLFLFTLKRHINNWKCNDITITTYQTAIITAIILCSRYCSGLLSYCTFGHVDTVWVKNLKLMGIFSNNETSLNLFVIFKSCHIVCKISKCSSNTPT